MHAFIEKLRLWYRRVQKGIAASSLDIALEKSRAKLEGEFKVEVESHFQTLKEEYDRYFPDLVNRELADWKMTRNPFRINEDILSDNLQEQFLEIKCNSTAKDDFEAISLNDFWAKYLLVYKNVGSVAIRTLLPFSSTYLCESGFSTLVSVKTKSRNKLECEADLRCALFSTKPRIKLLVSQKQLNPSHLAG